MKNKITIFILFNHWQNRNKTLRLSLNECLFGLWMFIVMLLDYAYFG